MPMLKGYEGIRAVVDRAVAQADAEMCRLEVALEDANWQHWLAESVLRADLVLADVTDNNPFVMYELGLAHQQGLPTTLIVNSNNGCIPATVRGTPFLPYADDDFASFENSLATLLRDAIQGLKSKGPETAASVAADRYLHYYNEALKLMTLFRASAAVAVNPVSRDEFFTRLSVAEHRGDRMPDNRNKRQIARYLLARMISNSDKVEVMRAAEEWIGFNY